MSYAHVSWSVDDIKFEAWDAFGLELTTDEALDFLSRNEKYIQERLVELGWNVINDLMRVDDVLAPRLKGKDVTA